MIPHGGLTSLLSSPGVLVPGRHRTGTLSLSPLLPPSALQASPPPSSPSPYPPSPWAPPQPGPPSQWAPQLLPIASVPSRSSSSTYLPLSCAFLRFLLSLSIWPENPSKVPTRLLFCFSTTSSHFPLRTSSSWSSSSKNFRRSIRSVFVESHLRVCSQYVGSFWETHWSVLPKFHPKIILPAPLSLPCASRLSPPSPSSSSPTLGDTSPFRSCTFLRPLPLPSHSSVRSTPASYPPPRPISP